MITVHGLDPLLKALVERLPQGDGPFTNGDRERWLAAADAVLQLLYPPAWTADARTKANEEVLAQSVEKALGEYVAGLAADVTAHLTDEVQQTTGNDSLVVSFDTSPLVEPVAGPPPPEPESPPAPAGSAVHASREEINRAWEAVQDRKKSESIPVEIEAAPMKPESKSSAIPPPESGKKRHFNASQKGHVIRRAILEGIETVVGDTLIHETTIRRWMREMPLTVKAAEEELETRTALEAEANPTVAQLEEEKARPVPPTVAQLEGRSTPAVQWPKTPIERRPFDPDAVRGNLVEGI